MGGATRFVVLLAAPFPPLRPSLLLLRHRLSTLTASPLRPFTLSSSCKIKYRTSHLVRSLHSQPNKSSYNLNLSTTSQQQHHHPWPEWTHFLNFLSDRQGWLAPSPVDLKIPPEDAFVVYEELPDDFVLAASSCLAFARDRPNLLGLLSRRNIEAVVSNGTPFLFKSALDCARRMRAFLGTDQYAPEYDNATTIDLMKYIISYASNPAVSSGKHGLYSRELVDSSTRNLLHELGAVSGASAAYAPAQEQQLSGRYGQSPRPLGRNIEMKRGDWVCSKCNFMNFARNMKCLECEEPRPKKQLTGGEWECPQCTFFNYGRNLVCLRCDCRRPGAPLYNTINSGSGSGYNGDYQFKDNIDSRLVENEGEQNRLSEISPRDSDVEDLKIPLIKIQETVSSEASNQGTVSRDAQSFCGNFSKDSGGESKVYEQSEKSENWFKKVVGLYDDKELPGTISGEDFPSMMPMRKGENQFVVTKKKDRSLTTPKYKRQVALDQAKDSNFVPFVPFPPGYFARKETEQPEDSSGKSTGDNSSHKVQIEAENFDSSRHILAPTRDDKTVSSEKSVFANKFMVDTSTDPRRDNPRTSTESSQFSDDITPPDSSPNQSSIMSHSINSNPGKPKMSEYENVRSSWTGKSLEGSAVKEPDPLDMSEEAKAERWFKRVAQIKDISELSQIPDEDFPSIMPMRKGVNRFVVSKRKTPLERRLTSQQYRRNLPIVSTDPVRNETDSS